MKGRVARVTHAHLHEGTVLQQVQRARTTTCETGNNIQPAIKTTTPHLEYTKSQHTMYVHNPPPQNSLEVSFYFLSGSEYLLRIALYRENLENSSASLITFRPRATDLLISSSEESSAFLCRASRTFSLNQASPDGCWRAASTALLQKFLTKGCIPERIRRQVLLLCDRAVAVKRKERNGGGG